VSAADFNPGGTTGACPPWRVSSHYLGTGQTPSLHLRAYPRRSGSPIAEGLFTFPVQPDMAIMAQERLSSVEKMTSPRCFHTSRCTLAPCGASSPDRARRSSPCRLRRQTRPLPNGRWLLALLLFAPQLGFAVDKIWTGAVSTDWSTNGNWTGNAPSAGDNAVFDSTFSNQPNVAGNNSVGGIWMTDSIGQNVTISGSGTLKPGGNTINGTPGLGILVDNTNSFTLTITAAIELAGAQTWTNNSGNLFTIGAGGVDIFNKALTINGSGNTTISGVVSNAGAFTKAGSGALTLSGTNTYTGVTSIQGGTVSVNTVKDLSTASALGAPTTTANGTIAIGSGSTSATLKYTGSGDSTNRVVDLAGTTGGATLDQSGTGTLTFTSNFTATGAGSKTLTLQGSTAGSGTISGAIVDNSVSDTTSVTKGGTGTWTLSGTNTYTGATTVNVGSLFVNGSTASGSAVTVNNSGTIGGNGTISGSISVASGGNLSPGASGAGSTAVITHRQPDP